MNEYFASNDIEYLCLVLYYFVLGVLVVFSLHRAWLLIGYWRHRIDASPPEPLPEEKLPTVTVQLPLYNEPEVSERLIDAVAKFDYPRDRFEIQVLDDSTDETPSRVARAVERARLADVRIEHIRRIDRVGFKAGALAFGLKQSNAELVAIFDADFVPGADFLRRTVPFFADPQVGMIQTRWGHLNREASLLTRVQSLFLDAHFRIEHAVRHASGRFFNFNGTAGVWRRAAIDEAGGWQHDTLTEDLDLSIRAQLAGWRFVYRDDIVAPAELPAIMSAYRSQQHRWAKGAMETTRKLLVPLWRSRVPLATKIDTAGALLGNVAYLLMLLLVMMSFPAFLAREKFNLAWLVVFDAAALIPATAVFAVFFGVAARARGVRWPALMVLIPCGLAVGIGMSVNNARAVVQGLLGRESPFVRTPKSGQIGAKAFVPGGHLSAASIGKRWLLPCVELVFGAYFVTMIATAALYSVGRALPFASLFALGFFLIAGFSLAEEWLVWRERARGATTILRPRYLGR